MAGLKKWRSSAGHWAGFGAETRSLMIPPPTAIRSSTWKNNVCRLVLFGWGKQAGVKGWDGIFWFIHHFKEGDQNKMKRFTFFSLPWPHSSVFIFPYIIFSPAWRSGGRGCSKEYCLTLLTAVYQLSSEPLRVVLLRDKLQPSSESMGKQHEWKGGHRYGREKQPGNQAAHHCQWGCGVCVPNGDMRPCLHWYWWVHQGEVPWSKHLERQTGRLEAWGGERPLKIKKHSSQRCYTHSKVRGKQSTHLETIYLRPLLLRDCMAKAFNATWAISWSVSKPHLTSVEEGTGHGKNAQTFWKAHETLQGRDMSRVWPAPLLDWPRMWMVGDTSSI